MKRLLTYLKPHRAAMLLVTLLVLALTALELYKPIVIGDAIDDYIEGYDAPYEQTKAGEPGAVSFQGESFRRVTEEQMSETGRYARILLYNDCYYMITGLEVQKWQALSDLTGDLLREQVEGLTPLTQKELALLREQDFAGICRAAVIYLGVMLAIFVCNAAQTWILQKTGQDIIYRMREQVFAHVQTLSVEFFNKTPVGKLVTRVANDTEAVNELFTTVLVKLFRNSIKIIGYGVVMFSIQVRLTVYAFLMLPVVAVLTFVFRHLSRKAYRITRNRLTEINTFLSENLSGMKLIQIFAREKEKYGEFEKKSYAFFRAGFREVMIFAIFRPLIYLLSVVALAVIIGGGSVQVLSSTITMGTLYIFINYISSFFDPIQELAEQFGTLQSSLASAEKVFQILDEKPGITNPKHPVAVDIIGKIEFRHVWFAYEGEDYILKDVSFVIQPGEKAAFVGATGAGKTSVLNLIGRYYDIQKGEILIDGVNIRQLDITQLRRAIGQVQQDVFLFTGDIKGNISLRNPDMTLEEIQAAAEYVNADAFIRRLPGGYDEPVTERGSTLSAGQRQLLSFARTLAYDPKILVLDEATANIDTETESLITQALEKLMAGRTTIMVAHRLSTIQHADKIMVMHKGCIVESGNHQELLRQDGMYRRLYELQLVKEGR